jgi:hypothetical protein
MWSRGDTILMRYGVPGDFRTVRPMTVVEHRDDLLVAWLAAGTPVVRPVMADGREIRKVPIAERFRLPRKGVRSRWKGPGVLKLIPARAAHSIWLFWRPNGRLRGWYVNLEERHRYWPGGLDTRDHVLDIWVPRPRRWQWKDEDEFAEAVQQGRLTRAEADAIRAEGRRVIERVERWRKPFNEGWERFLPDPAWPLPSLPQDWREEPRDRIAL